MHTFHKVVLDTVSQILISYGLKMLPKRRSKARLRSHPISSEEPEDKTVTFLIIWHEKNYSIISGIIGAFDWIYGSRFCSSGSRVELHGDRTLILSGGLYMSN